MNRGFRLLNSLKFFPHSAFLTPNEEQNHLTARQSVEYDESEHLG